LQRKNEGKQRHGKQSLAETKSRAHQRGNKDNQQNLQRNGIDCTLRKERSYRDAARSDLPLISAALASA
jgi:hypothetical protein